MIKDRRNTFRVAIAAALMSGGVNLAPAQSQAAQAPDQTVESYGDWSMRCIARQDLPPCDLVQVATDNQTKAQVMRFSIAYAGDRDKYGVQVVVPLGVLVSGGVLVRVDDKDDITTLKFTRCEASGCYIEALLDADAFAPFQRGKKGVLAILDGQGKSMVMPLSFKGFKDAMEAMSSRNRQWAQDKKSVKSN